jgi:hypothetical protein
MKKRCAVCWSNLTDRRAWGPCKKNRKCPDCAECHKENRGKPFLYWRRGDIREHVICAECKNAAWNSRYYTEDHKGVRRYFDFSEYDRTFGGIYTVGAHRSLKIQPDEGAEPPIDDFRAFKRERIWRAPKTPEIGGFFVHETGRHADSYHSITPILDNSDEPTELQRRIIEIRARGASWNDLIAELKCGKSYARRTWGEFRHLVADPTFESLPPHKPRPRSTILAPLIRHMGELATDPDGSDEFLGTWTVTLARRVREGAGTFVVTFWSQSSPSSPPPPPPPPPAPTPPRPRRAPLISETHHCDLPNAVMLEVGSNLDGAGWSLHVVKADPRDAWQKPRISFFTKIIERRVLADISGARPVLTGLPIASCRCATCDLLKVGPIYTDTLEAFGEARRQGHVAGCSRTALPFASDDDESPQDPNVTAVDYLPLSRDEWLEPEYKRAERKRLAEALATHTGPRAKYVPACAVCPRTSDRFNCHHMVPRPDDVVVTELPRKPTAEPMPRPNDYLWKEVA